MANKNAFLSFPPAGVIDVATCFNFVVALRHCGIGNQRFNKSHSSFLSWMGKVLIPLSYLLHFNWISSWNRNPSSCYILFFITYFFLLFLAVQFFFSYFCFRFASKPIGRSSHDCRHSSPLGTTTGKEKQQQPWQPKSPLVPGVELRLTIMDWPWRGAHLKGLWSRTAPDGNCWAFLFV